MVLEVEQKFHVADRPALERQIRAPGAAHLESIDQVDCYFAHPARDFAQTDEALRLRHVGDINYITYKGPKLDSTTKSREEIEIELASGSEAAAGMAGLLEALGFKSVAQVHKRRDRFMLGWRTQTVEIALDRVAELGDFVELEIMAAPRGLDDARNDIAALADRLGLTASERRSYSELLLERRGASGAE